MLSALFAATVAATPQPGLAPLDFLVGQCWEGRFESGETDTHCFEPAYGGQHVRDRHRVTGGKRLYEGETLYSWDGKAGAVIFTYWNSLGGVSRGTMTAAGDRLDFGDQIYRAPDGRQHVIKTHWQRTGPESYRTVTRSAGLPSMDRTVTFRRLTEPPVSVTAYQAPDGTHGTVHETLVAATPKEVWRAISTADGWRTWATPAAWLDGDLLETSYSADASPGDETTIRQKFLAAVPHRLLVFRTTKASKGFPHFDEFSRVTHLIELEPAGETRTRVRLTGAGYADNEAGRQLLGFFTEGNRVSLDRLRRRFETGPLDWAQEEGSKRRSAK